VEIEIFVKISHLFGKTEKNSGEFLKNEAKKEQKKFYPISSDSLYLSYP